MSVLTRGAVYIAYGPKALAEFEAAKASLREYMPRLPIAQIAGADLNFPGRYTDVQRSRWAKVNLDKLTPFDLTLYLDADTRVRGDLSHGFDILAAGWDVALVTSENQGSRLLMHCSPEDKEATLRAAGCHDVLQHQCGVFFFASNDRTAELFAAWRHEWLMFRDQDQGAFIRALIKAPVNLWLLGKPWNGGGLVEHLFGRARA